MKWVINYDKRYKSKYIIWNIILIIFDTLGIIPSLLLGVIVDQGLKQGNNNIVLYTSIFLIVFIICKTLGSFFSIIQLSKVSLDITTEIKKDCYDKLNEMDSAFYKRYSPGELMTTMTSDIATLRRVIIHIIKKVISIFLTFIIALIYCLNVNVLLTLIVLSPAIFITIISINFIKNTKDLYEDSREKLSSLNNFIMDNIEGNKVVRSFSQEEEEIKKMKIKNNELKDILVEKSNKGLEYVSKVNFCSRSMMILCILFGSLFLMKGNITIGQLIVFNSILYALRSPFEVLFDLIDSMQSFNISKNRLYTILHEEPKIKHEGTIKPKSLLCDIEFKNVGLNIEDNCILSDINIKIKKGETIAFIGPTGSGKSIIVNLLLGFIEKTSGQILIDNHAIEDISIKWLRERIGYVSQQPFLFSDTISNNIRYGKTDLSDEEMKYYSNISHLTFVPKLEEEYETIIGERGVGLSGGEKQRLSLARALAVKPELLILDDITSALDTETELIINENLKQLSFNCTKIIIAEKILSVKDADIIYVIDNGNIIESGSHKELIKKKGYYYDIYKIQNIGKVGDLNESK